LQDFVANVEQRKKFGGGFRGVKTVAPFVDSDARGFVVMPHHGSGGGVNRRLRAVNATKSAVERSHDVNARSIAGTSLSTGNGK
jgi:hypothetical protein